MSAKEGDGCQEAGLLGVGRWPNACTRTDELTETGLRAGAEGGPPTRQTARRLTRLQPQPANGGHSGNSPQQGDGGPAGQPGLGPAPRGSEALAPTRLLPFQLSRAPPARSAHPAQRCSWGEAR